MNILIVGSGAREHAMALAIVNSPLCTKLFAAPGNPGIGEVAELVPIPVTEIELLVAHADRHEIDFVIVGPEAPLVLGLVDALSKRGILAFGPTQAAARLEESKAFTKELCVERNIPTAHAAVYTDTETALAHVRRHALPMVVKADGLAAGKGVTIARTRMEAEEAVTAAFAGKFGEAGETLVIEEFLDGEEVSLFALCDGKRAVLFGSAQDHKAAHDGDTGPNTGGMGAYSPVPLMTPTLEDEVMHRIVDPTLAAMAARGTPFRGVLFAGLMITADGPKLIEYNVRFGDPECEVLMARLDCDLLHVLMACAGGDMGNLRPKLRSDSALCTIMAAKGYPERYETGTPIGDLAPANAVEGVTVLHAGTKCDARGALVANGGRVLAVTGKAPILEDARARVYQAIEAIEWADGYHRNDIGWRALAAVK